MKQFVIIGAGGYAKEVMWITKDINKGAPTFDFPGFLDPLASGIAGRSLYGHPVFGGWDELPGCDELYFACGIGDPTSREKECIAAEARGLRPVSVIHPSVIVADEVTIGAGTVISPNSVLAPSCTLGRHCALNIGAVIGHDARLDDYCVISPGALVLGGAHLETKAFLGANSTVYLAVTMGESSLLGANSFLVTNLRAGTSALGIPATRLGAKPGAGICHNKEASSSLGKDPIHDAS